jgi:hypothetical protein
MSCPFGKQWLKKYLQALKLARERGHISDSVYYKLRKQVLKDDKK